MSLSAQFSFDDFDNNDLYTTAMDDNSNITLQFVTDDPEDSTDFLIMDINNNYLHQPYNYQEYSSDSILDPDDNLIAPTSVIELMPLSMPHTEEIVSVPASVQAAIDETLSSPPALIHTTSAPHAFSVPLPEQDSEQRRRAAGRQMIMSPKRVPLASLAVNCAVPHTPQKSSGHDPMLDPLTPTANLKILISAVSPEIRNRDNLRQLIEAEVRKNTCVEKKRVYIDTDNGINTRKEKSLGLLCQRFLSLFPEYPSNGTSIAISLDSASKDLGVERRRIYDIVNVLESLMMVQRMGKNRYIWLGKTALVSTLQRLKVNAVTDGYQAKIAAAESHELQREIETFDNCLKASDSVDVELSNICSRSSNDLILAKAGMRKDKSLGILSQKFVMLFLVSGGSVITMELAARVLTDDHFIDRNDCGKMKTKIRRLYDIANILISLDLIEKVWWSNNRGRKPGFRFIGPTSNDPVSVQPRTLAPAAGENKAAQENLAKCGQRRRPGNGKSFVRHSSFDLICRAAEEERARLYSAKSSPVKGPLQVSAHKSVVVTYPAQRAVRLSHTALIITDINQARKHEVTSLRADERDDGDLSDKAAKRPKLDTDPKTGTNNVTQVALQRVKTDTIYRVSPRALLFDNLQIQSQVSVPPKIVSLNAHEKEAHLETSPDNGVEKGKTTSSSDSLSQQLPQNDHYMTPVRILDEKEITPTLRTILFHTMKAKLASPDQGKPIRSPFSLRDAMF